MIPASVLLLQLIAPWPAGEFTAYVQQSIEQSHQGIELVQFDGFNTNLFWSDVFHKAWQVILCFCSMDYYCSLLSWVGDCIQQELIPLSSITCPQLKQQYLLVKCIHSLRELWNFVYRLSVEWGDGNEREKHWHCKSSVQIHARASVME